MKILLSASVDFSWETIDSLVEGIQDVFPAQVNVIKKYVFESIKKRLLLQERISRLQIHLTFL